MSGANTGWIKSSQRDRLLPGSRVLIQMDDYVLVWHPSIPPEADHVAIESGAYVVIPNPSAAAEARGDA